MSDLKFEELVDIMVKQISDANNPEDREAKCRKFIKEYIRIKNAPKNIKGGKDRISKLLTTIQQKDLEVSFWRDVVRELDLKNINKYYDAINQLLIQNGFLKTNGKPTDQNG